MTKLSLKIHRTHPGIELPRFQTKESACFDLSFNALGKSIYKGYNAQNAEFSRNFSNSNGAIAGIHLGAGERILVPTGLVFDIPKGYSVRVHPRSGLSLKKGITIANMEGVIDSDYVEELYVLLYNMSENHFTVNHGDRIAQAELVKSEKYNIEDIVERPGQKTDRAGGLGSTGISQVADQQEIKIKLG